MEGAEHSQYVAQLKAEFDSCDTTSTGFLDRDELTALCGKLQLDAHLPLLLDTLLGGRAYARVNFEEFKNGFVAVLSRSLDFSTSEDDSSYLEPVVPEEVKPKFVKGTKRYGRRSRPDISPDAALSGDSEDSPPSRAEVSDLSPPGVRRAKLRRATSLESVESLKSDDEAGSHSIQTPFQSKGDQQEEPEVGGGRCVMAAACDQLGLRHLHTQEVEVLPRKTDAHLDGRVSVREFKNVLCGSAPISCSTPVRSADLQRAPHKSQAVFEERSVRSTSTSLLTATVGQRVLSRLDEGSGCTGPERVVSLWTEEGIRNSRDILQTLDFSLEERLSLTDLTLALDNELLVSGNWIHQAALVSYKDEVQHLLEVAEQACRERDKAKADLDQADHRNLQLVREVDDRHVAMETLNQSRIRELEQDFRERLAALRGQSEQESEALLQQAERERGALWEELRLLRVQEAELQEELRSTVRENGRLEEELGGVRLKLSEAENAVTRLQRGVDQLLHDKLSGLDPSGGGLSHEERCSELVKEYELQCRELRDRNDELSSEVELLKSHRNNRKYDHGDGDALNWRRHESDSDDSDVKRRSPPSVQRKLQPPDKTALCSLDDVSGPGVSIQTELALEQLKENHEAELQQLRIQLDTQVNYYERSLEMMRQSMEVERKDISQAFKMEISELEEQKSEVEQQVKELKEAVEKLQSQIQHGGGGGGWSNEQERRMQREHAELEQNFAREIGNLVQRLSAEKDQLEAELKLKMDQEVMLVREESERQLAGVKRQDAEAQRRLLHQLHREHQRLQEQRGFWEERRAQWEQEKKQQEEELRLLKEQVSGQSNAGLQEELEACRGRCSELEACRGRCSELEARLEEACAQLEESISFLEAQEVLNKQLASENSSAQEALQAARTREDEVLVQVSQLKAELLELRAVSHGLLRDREEATDSHSRLSGALAQQQAALRAREQTAVSLRAELEDLQEALRSRTEAASGLTAELDSLKTDRARLIQDLKEQAMAVDNLQLQLDAVSEELERRRSGEDGLREELREEQTRSSQLRSDLAEEKEEVGRLSQENAGYTRLADQLSTQIVEMEAELATLRDHLRDLSAQLNNTADLVLDLRRQLNAKSGEEERRRAEDGEWVLQLQRALQDARDRLRTAEDEFQRDKKKLSQQLVELEELVLVLEDVMDPASPHRTQLEAVRLENAALQERLSVLQQEVQSLEDDVSKKRRRLEEVEREHERSRAEEERLHRENSQYREEVLDLSSRNLQLSNDNAELSARLRGDQESVRMLRERLTTVSKEQEEEGATVRRLQDAMTQQEQEKLQLQRELSSCRDKLGRQAELEAELSGATLKLQWVEDDKSKLLRDAEDRNNKVEKLQQRVMSLEAEAELLRSQFHSVTQEKLGHAQEVSDLQRKLHDAHTKVDELDADVRKLVREGAELRRALEEREEQAAVTLQEETHRLRVHVQELQDQLSERQVQDLQVQKLTWEQQDLKTRLNETEAARIQAQDQALRADTALGVERAQHVRRLQRLQQEEGGARRKEAELLQVQLEEEQRRRRQLEEELRLQGQHSSSQVSLKQGQYEKAMASLQQKGEELETRLRGARLLLQEKVQQLKEQLVKNSECSALLKDVYVENSQLMKALQVTERRQKLAEGRSFQLEEKVTALNRLLREVVTAALAT